MDEIKQNKVTRFLNDELLATTVKEIIRDSFLKPKSRDDIHMLAASRIAIDLLDEAWKELEKYRLVIDDKANGGISKQVGV